MAAALRLITIPISHYCEKARWALEWAGVDYQEDAHLQVFHYLPVWRAGGKRTVPVLVHAGGSLTDSADILRFADAHADASHKLFPAAAPERAAVERLCAQFDRELGPAGRLWMYHHLLVRAPELAFKYGCAGVPRWQRRLLPPAFPLVRLYIQRLLGVNPQAAAAAHDCCQRLLDQVAAQLEGGRPYLGGPCFGAADLTFAALCAPLLMVPQYGVPLPQLSELPADVSKSIRAFREHPAGRFALGLYQRHRFPLRSRGGPF